MCPITRRLIDKLTLVEIKMLILSLTNAVSGYAKSLWPHQHKQNKTKKKKRDYELRDWTIRKYRIEGISKIEKLLHVSS
jgi:hypothetical protein